MNGYDIDGVLSKGIEVQKPAVCISGRTLAEWDATCAQIAWIMPVFIRGDGAFGDVNHAGRFKAETINRLGVTRFYEDDPAQAAIIQASCPRCTVVMVK